MNAYLRRMSKSVTVGPAFALRHIGFCVRALSIGCSASCRCGIRLEVADRHGADSCLDACPDTDSAQDEVIADHSAPSDGEICGDGEGYDGDLDVDCDDGECSVVHGFQSDDTAEDDEGE